MHIAPLMTITWPGGARRALAQQAQADYAAARGTVHLRLLRAARGRAEAGALQIGQALAAAQAQTEALHRERRNAVVTALEAHLAHDRFAEEVEGVGAVLAERILQHAFRGRLADLTEASRWVEGIGAARQQQIDRWVHLCQRRLPALIEGDFPGKAQVVQRYASAQARAESEAQRLAEQQAANGERLARLEQTIAGLSRVTVRDFERALLEPGPPNAALDAYLRGVYPEWEPAPAWFAELAAGEVGE